MRQLAVASLIAGAAGHGYINEPPSRTGATMEAGGSCPYGSCLWFNQGCTIGCPKCLGVDGGFNGCGADQGKATLPKELFTYNVGKSSCGVNPWCAPGSAPIMDPCGLAGGDVKQGSAGNGGDAPPGYKQGTLGSSMPALKGWKRTWKVGDAVDASWAVIANHGGGYQYRLCPKGQEASEACFQKTPLEFVGDEQYIQYCPIPAGFTPRNPPVSPTDTPVTNPPEKAYGPDGSCDRTNRTAIPAARISTGTVPAGSTWTRNPIPACKSLAGGAFNLGCLTGYDATGKAVKVPKASDYQFPPAGLDLGRPGGYLLGGFGVGACGGCNQNVNPKDCGLFGKIGRNNCTDGSDGSLDEITGQLFQWSVVDQVRVPDVPPGDYVVSFRWESEQTPQIWSQCSDVTIVAA